MKYIDPSENVVYDSDNMELISDYQTLFKNITIYKTKTGEYFAILRRILRKPKMIRVKDWELRQFLLRYDVKKYIEIFEPEEV